MLVTRFAAVLLSCRIPQCRIPQYALVSPVLTSSIASRYSSIRLGGRVEDKLRRLQLELEETKALLLLSRVQGNVRYVLENLKADLEKQISTLDRREHPRYQQK